LGHFFPTQARRAPPRTDYYSPQFWNEGRRFHTLFGPAEVTTFVWYDNTRQGALGDLKWVPYTNLFEYDAPASVEFGVTADAPLPLPETGRGQPRRVGVGQVDRRHPGDLVRERPRRQRIRSAVAFRLVVDV
jgi:hypothetical protein